MYNKNIIEEFEIVKEIIANIRTIRNKRNISKNKPIDLYVKIDDNYPIKYESVIKKLGNVNNILYV
jgi:valyl-tRNA synthetase